VSDSRTRLLAFDRERSREGGLRLAGTDEAGRGCLAGPVVAAAVELPFGWAPEVLDDSKRLSAPRRERVYAQIIGGALAWGAFAVWPREIEDTDILRASLRAMSGAVSLLRPAPDLVLVDGNRLPDLDCPAETLVRGDALSAAVAAASVVAKVVRDRLMCDLDARWPSYGFAGHKGYGAAAHLAAIATHGPCPLHRMTFQPLASLGQGRLW
jgi:ribonuclease HII